MLTQEQPHLGMAGDRDCLGVREGAEPEGKEDGGTVAIQSSLRGWISLQKLL